MAGVRTNSEKKIENDVFKLKLGTTNKLDPQVVYVEGRAFISPKYEEDDYSRKISEIKHALKHTISEGLKNNNLFDNKFILDFQVASNGISIDKKSFLSFQFLLRQNKDNVLKLSQLKDSALDFINNVVNSLSKTIVERDFELTKTKK